MKKIFLYTLLWAFCPLLTLAQTSPIDALFDQYAQKDGFTTVYISSFMFSMLQQFTEDEKDDDVKSLINKLEGIKILTQDENFKGKKVNFFQELNGKIPFKEYKELMVVKEKGQEFKMLLKEPKDGKSGEFLMIGDGEENLLISIVGNIDVETLSKLSKTTGLKGMDKLKKINDKDSVKTK